MDENAELEARMIENDPERLTKIRESTERTKKFATERVKRCEDLMARRSSKKWSPEKTAKMVRRYVTAQNEFDKAENILAHVEGCLEKIKAARLASEQR